MKSIQGIRTENPVVEIFLHYLLLLTSLIAAIKGKVNITHSRKTVQTSSKNSFQSRKNSNK